MIIYGSKFVGKKNRVQAWAYCQQCDAYAKTLSYTARKWGHLYFIPLIPMGGPMRIIRQCPKCKLGIHLPEKKVPEVVGQLCADTKSALAALLEGRPEFTAESGDTLPAVPFLASSVEQLFCLGAHEHLQLVMGALEARKLDYPFHMMKGEEFSLLGDLEEAARHFARAVEREPSSSVPLVHLAVTLVYQKNLDKARAAYERALAVAPDPIPIWSALVWVYEKLGEVARQVDAYEECLRGVPELRHDKKYMKAYQKACKKAGRTPAIEPG